MLTTKRTSYQKIPRLVDGQRGAISRGPHFVDNITLVYWLTGTGDSRPPGRTGESGRAQALAAWEETAAPLRGNCGAD